MSPSISKYNKGFSMVEALISMAIALSLIYAVGNLNAQTARVSNENMTMLKAQMYTTEAIEAVKDLASSAPNWFPAGLGPTCPASACHPVFSVTGWSLSSGSELLDGMFTRSVSLYPVYRSPCTYPNQIAVPPVSVCILDASTEKAIATTTWTDNTGSHTQVLEAYLYQP